MEEPSWSAPEIKVGGNFGSAKNRSSGYFKTVLLALRSKCWILLKLPVTPTQSSLLVLIP